MLMNFCKCKVRKKIQKKRRVAKIKNTEELFNEKKGNKKSCLHVPKPKNGLNRRSA